MRVFQHVDVAREHLFAQRVEQKRGFAVHGPAADGLHKAAEQACGQGRFEQHRALGGGNFAAIQAGQRALGGVAAHGLRAGQVSRVALAAVPVVALHLRALARNGGHRQAVARAGVTTGEDAGFSTLAAAHVRRKEVRLLGRHTRAFAVGDLLAGGKRRRFAFKGNAQSLFRRERPGVEQVQVGPLVGNVFGVGQTGKRVLGSEARNVVGGLHRLLDGGLRKVRRGRVAPAAADVHRHAQRLVAVALHVLQLALAHRDAQAAALGGIGTGIAGTQLSGMCQGGVHQLFKTASAVLKAA